MSYWVYRMHGAGPVPLYGFNTLDEALSYARTQVRLAGIVGLSVVLEVYYGKALKARVYERGAGVLAEVLA